MTQTRRRQVLITLGTGAVGAVAGCVGDTDDDDPVGPDNDTEADDADDTDDGSEEHIADADGEFDQDVWEPMQFAFEARYEWDLFIEGDEGSLVWDVVEIEGDEITVETEFVLGEIEFEQSMTGTQQELEGDLIASPAGIAFLWTAFSPMMGGLVGEQFTVGDEWSYSAPEGSVSYAVTELDTSSYPVDCYVVEMHKDDQLLHEGCVSPDHGMAVYSAWYDDGDLDVEIELVSFQRH